jgi:hypothetical protein
MANKNRIDKEMQKAQGLHNPMMEDQLGRALRPEDVARYLGLDVKTVRAYYTSLGGVRLGRCILFFEKEVINAIQKRSKMGGPSENQREAEGEDIPEQEGSGNMGKQGAIKSRRDMAREDKHGILV